MGLISESSAIDMLLIFVASVVYLYYFATKTFNHWKILGIKYVKPLPLLGNALDNILQNKHTAFLQQDMYNTFSDEKYFGTFFFRTPSLVVRDPNLITRFLINDFSHFYNRTMQFDEELDPLFAHLVFLNDQRWKNLRNKLTPVFSSGKLKSMYSQVEECANEMDQFFHEAIKENGLLDMRECTSKFTTDVIGSCAFGMQFNSLKDPDSEFRRVGREIFKNTFRGLVRLILTSINPIIPRILNFKIMPPEMEQFYINFIRDTVQYREQNNINRNDFVQLLMEIRKKEFAAASEFVMDKNVTDKPMDATNTEVLFNDNVMAANAFVFFAAGFETTAATLAYCLLELAANLNLQNKMRQEILDAINKNDGKLTYDVAKNLEYVEKVLSETLRKYPVLTQLGRKCSKTYKLPNIDLVIEKGTNIVIPVYSIHHDPQYYPEPDRFDPERFSEENKTNRPDGTFLPFGDGPRICIGQRFAWIVMKIYFCIILPKYEFRMSNKMKYPLEYNSKANFLTPLNSIWLNVYERK